MTLRSRPNGKAHAQRDEVAISAAARATCSSWLDRPAPSPALPPLIAAFGTLCMHGALISVATFLSLHSTHAATAPTAVTQMVEVELPPPVAPEADEPPALPEQDPVIPEAKPKVVPETKPVRAKEPAAAPTPTSPPPVAAQAAAVLAASDEVADFGDAIVSGKAATFAGGTTEAAGKSMQAVRDTRARAGGVQGGQGEDLRADKSRAPRLAGSGEWDCAFPDEAYDEGIDTALVGLHVEVAPDGKVLAVQIKSDPGSGFGREARRCALRKVWSPGLDRAGQPTRSVALVNVRFTR